MYFTAPVIAMTNKIASNNLHCGFVDAGFEEIQTFVHFIKAGIHLILEPIQTIISFLLLNLHLLQDC